MSRAMNSSSTLSNEGLQSDYQKRRERSIFSVSMAIEWLRKTDQKLSLNSISEATKKFSVGGVKVSASTILRNQECFALYNNAVDPKRRKMNAKKTMERHFEGSVTDSEMRRFHFLKRLSKAELLAMVVGNERKINELEAANSRLRDDYLIKTLGPLL